MTKDEIIRMAREAWVFPEAHIPNILEFANLVAAAEREACAKVVEQAGIDGYGTLAAALLIRERARHEQN